MDGTPPYYLNRGVSGSGSASGPSGSVPASGSGTQTGLPAPPGFKTSSNPNISFQSNVGSTYQVENPSPSFPHGIAMGVAPSGVSPGDTGKKKRGRPRKYGPDSANMSLLLSPMSSTPSPGSLTPRRGRGRPPGSGRKQQLASLGEWMNTSAGLAFTPHVIHIGAGEDIAMKVLSFAQHRPRALCILSANGTVSAVQLCQPSGGTVTYEVEPPDNPFLLLYTEY
ncbi:unnamed protein product [Ilex paraguariensis]|uniref:AT-hook motif nuclear-localized protein n=1 Tax=Ilex paraguariensis TaxID=185542 RepID=A0ABC8UU82_9AQUA